MAHKMEVQTSGKSMSAQLFADAYHSAQPTVVLRDVNTPNTKWLLDNRERRGLRDMTCTWTCLHVVFSPDLGTENRAPSAHALQCPKTGS